MRWFFHSQTRTKLMLSLGSLVVLVAAVILVALGALGAMERNYRVTVNVTQLESNLNAGRINSLTLITVTDPEELRRRQETTDHRKQENEELLHQLTEDSKGDRDLSKYLGEWQSIHDELKAEREKTILPLMQDGKKEEAQAINLGAQQARYDRIREVGHKMAEHAHQKATGAVNLAKLILLGLGGVALVTAIILAVLLNRLIVDPLREMSAAAERIAAGDLSGTITTVPRRDEVGLLAQSFRKMNGSLQAMARGAEQVAAGNLSVVIRPQSEKDIVGNALAAMVQRLSALIGQVQRSGIQVTTSSTEIAATARQQQATASEILSTTTEVASTAREISSTAKELVAAMKSVTAVSEETAALAESGKAGLTRMEATMRQITEASSSINSRLAVLSEKAGNINSVVTTITKVADQTNLLSLNAAIEAEKAGEYGRGFSVVATEIRRLADQTAGATAEIEQMVKEMQSAVAAGVMGMDKFSEEVRRGGEAVAQVGAQLTEIIGKVQTLTPNFETVNEGMQSQSLSAQQISEALVQLGEAAKQTVESLRQSSMAIEQLTEVTGGLQSGISRFKLER